MDQAIEMVGAGLIVPAAVSAIVAYLCQFLFPSSVSRRCALSAALAAGYLAGYACLPEWAAWIPSRHYHWLPILAAVAGLVGPISFARGVWTGERITLNLVFAMGTACLLVPDWETLQPVRARYIASLTLYLFVLGSSLPPLANRFKAEVWLSVLAIISIALGLAIFAGVSIRFGQLTGLLIAATIGTGVSAGWQRKAFSLEGVSFAFSLLAGALAFVASLDPDPPVRELLVLPAVPLILWGTSSLPGRQPGTRATVIDLVAVATLASLVNGWVLLSR